MFHALHTISEATCGEGEWKEFDGMGLLLVFYEKFKALNAIKAYLASERCIPLTENETGKAPWRPSGYR